jgi:hypothetical protein
MHPRDEEEIMPIVVLSDTPGMTRDQYDVVVAELGLRDALPQGCLLFIGGVGPDGSIWRDVMVWESAPLAKDFMDTTLRPAMERAGAVPIWGPPVNWDVHELFM